MEQKENKILIITGGCVDDAFLSDYLLQEQYSMIIAADSGLAAADRLNIELDYIVGDFDSVSETVLQKYRKLSTPIKTFPKEKDKTDTQIAIELALMNHANHLDIIGATGSRLDHVLANIHLLLLPMQLKVRASLIDGNNRIYLRQKSFNLKKQEQFGDYVSLLPFTEKVRGLTLRGFKYPLNQIVLTSGNSLGISNEIMEEEASVEFTEGILLVIESRD
jgi:thiamine pyrophosphokinase